MSNDVSIIWLKSLIPETVEIHNNTRCSNVEKTKGGYRVTWSEDGIEHSVTARMIIGADGAASMVRRAVYPKLKIRTYLSVQQWFKDRHATPFYSCIFDPDVTDCYAWGLSKNDCFIFGGAFAPKNARGNFEMLKEKLKSFGFRFDDPIKTEACLVLRPSGLFDHRCDRNGAFLIGEAAGFISPSSLEGISYAINSAFKLSRILNRGYANPNRRYWQTTLGIRLKLFLKCLKSPFMYFPPLRWLVMQSGVNSIPVENDMEA